MRLFFIRHGQSTNNALLETTGSDTGRSEDPELTEAGKQQVILLGDFIRDKDKQALGHEQAVKRDYFGFTHLYTSLMIRSVQTGAAISSAINLPLVAWPDIHETGGIYLDDPLSGEPQGLAGKTRSFFLANYPMVTLPESLNEEGWWNRSFETREERPSRARKVLHTLLEQHGNTEDRVAVISHGGFFVQLMRVIFEISGEKIWFNLSNTGITCIDFTAKESAILQYHNRTDHLPDHLVT